MWTQFCGRHTTDGILLRSSGKTTMTSAPSIITKARPFRTNHTRQYQPLLHGDAVAVSRPPMPRSMATPMVRHPWIGGTSPVPQERILRYHDSVQLQQYSTKSDVDRFEPEDKALEELRVGKESEKKKIYFGNKLERRQKLLAEERKKYTFRYDIWEDTIRNLLDEDVYPVGFTNTYDRGTIASWCQQISHTLQQTLSLSAAMSLEMVLQLLDRLFQEQEAHVPGSPTGVAVLMSTDVSSLAIECALKSWKFSLAYPPFYEQMTVEQVQRAQERVAYYEKFLAKDDDSLLAHISKLLHVDRIIHTKTKSTDRLLWGHIPHTRHPNKVKEDDMRYYMSDTEMEFDLDTSSLDNDTARPNDAYNW